MSCNKPNGFLSANKNLSDFRLPRNSKGSSADCLSDIDEDDIDVVFNCDDNRPKQYDINETFVKACENGDFNLVNRIINSISDFNIEVMDNMDKTALRLAVENDHLEIVQLLLNKSDSHKIRDALLLAIYLGHTNIAEAILKHPKYKILNEKKFLNGDQDSFWQMPSSDDAQFSPDITPIMLAAQYNRIEIVQMLLLNGNRISKPHDYNCKCNECLNKFKFDSLRHAQSRLNAYKGLVSESYISLASIDPILTAFELGHELKILSEKEKHFKHEYLQLLHSLNIFSYKLLNNVRGRDELEIVLNKTGKERKEKYEKLARFDLALRFREKHFVAHSNCQQKLDEIWSSGIRKISKMNISVKFILVVLHVFLIPFTSFVSILLPESKIGKFMTQPCVKFISHFTSYVAFCIMISLSYSGLFDYQQENQSFLSLNNQNNATENITKIFTAYSQRTDLKYHAQFSDFYIRPHVPSFFDIFITIWVVGQFFHEITRLFDYGVYNYLYAPVNVINFSMNGIYLVSLGLKYYTMIMVNIKINLIKTAHFWNKVQSLSNRSSDPEQFDVYLTFYWLNSDRIYWQGFDPINFSEALYAIANLLTYARLCFYLPANQLLGILQITFAKMINDIIKFICIFVIVFTSFLFGLNSLFWYYKESVRDKVEIITHSETGINAGEAFGTIADAYMTLFSSMYKFTSSDDITIRPFRNDIAISCGYFLFALFHVANITVMMNMLIAMMFKSFENIFEHSDIEWKFARSKLYMEFIKEGYTLPIPFNLLQIPFFLVLICKRFCMSKQPIQKSNKTSFTAEPIDDQISNLDGIEMRSRSKVSVNYEVNVNDDVKVYKANETITKNHEQSQHEEKKLTYNIVMDRVKKRYLMYSHSKFENKRQNEMNEILEEISLMRHEINNDMKKTRDYEMKNMLKVNGFIQIMADEIKSFNGKSKGPINLMDCSDQSINLSSNCIENLKNKVHHERVVPLLKLNDVVMKDQMQVNDINEFIDDEFSKILDTTNDDFFFVKNHNKYSRPFNIALPGASGRISPSSDKIKHVFEYNLENIYEEA